MLARAALVGLLAMAIVPVDARADAFCDQLQSLAAAATTDFTGVDESDPGFEGVETCSLSLASGGIRRLTCRWAFDYRAEAARTKLSALDEDVRACLPGLAVSDDVGVNHPDTFEQRGYTGDGITVSLSLKDKIALGATYVFIGLERTR